MVKKVVSFRIEESAWNDFKNFVNAKYGQQWRALGDEAERAFVSWVSSGKHTRTHTNSTPLNPRHQRSVETAREIYNEVCRIAPNDHFQIPLQQVEKAIGSIVSNDSRMLKKYVPMLLNLGFLAETKAPGVYAITERIEVEALKRKGEPVDERKLVANSRGKFMGDKS